MPAVSSSSYASVMVHVDTGRHAEDRVRLASAIAERFAAWLIGVSAEEIIMPTYPETPSFIEERLIKDEQRRIAEDLAGAEAMFRRTATTGRLEWRGAAANPADHVLRQARMADLVLLGRPAEEDDEGWHLAALPADVIMGLGRPMLVAPPGVSSLLAERILVAWKDTREARRALRDSLPFLQSAQEVSIVGFGEEVDPDSLHDVTEFLGRHGIKDAVAAHRNVQFSVAEELLELADDEDIDLVVCGAYGHSRLREWILGGVTHDLLRYAPICCFMSH
jgi:nucleotide-binding universal stress UspA family protein